VGQPFIAHLGIVQNKAREALAFHELSKPRIAHPGIVQPKGHEFIAIPEVGQPRIAHLCAGQFKTLAAALKAADLVATLKGPGPFTVFAPTDEAFAKLPAGTVENLLKPENKAKLTAILTYHVVPGAVTADQVTKLDQAKTVNGAMVKVTAKGGKVTINDRPVHSYTMTNDVQYIEPKARVY